MRITVLHNVSRDASFGLNAMFTGDGKRYVSRTHELVKVFEFEADLGPNSVFRAFNVGDDPELSSSQVELELAQEYRSHRLRSLSVGDVLAYDGQTYLACESVGWREIDADELHVLDGDEADRAIRDRYGFKAGEQLSISVPFTS